MNINRLHTSSTPYITPTQNTSHINEHFMSLIPGDELSDCIKAVVDYCKSNNTSATLEFNGVANKIEPWIDPKDLAIVWYSNPNDEWYLSRKVIMRDNKITQILNIR